MIVKIRNLSSIKNVLGLNIVIIIFLHPPPKPQPHPRPSSEELDQLFSYFFTLHLGTLKYPHYQAFKEIFDPGFRFVGNIV